MGTFSKLFFNRGVVVFLESLKSSRVVAYSKTSVWFNIPAMLLTGVTFGHFDAPMVVKIAGFVGVSMVLNSAARLRTIHLPNKEALEWKSAHAEWIAGGKAPTHPDVKKSFDLILNAE